MQRWKIVGYTLAVLVGVAGAWHQRADLTPRALTAPVIAAPVPVATAPASAIPASQALPTAATAVAARVEPSSIVVSKGMRVGPVHEQGAFIGYRVIENTSDPRFEAGQIITAVGGTAVEDSAAGGELLIAVLRNPNADVTVIAASDAWPELH
jgi:hypothetical protein